ncbi:MAG: UDP-N-acetylmuramoyl-L-alanyl-D-glutamate--2,6-diaminopimelate ligase [Persicimonas sp.]
MKLTALIDQLDQIEPVSTEEAGLEAVEVSDLAFDSREVAPGTLFIALKGASADGHDFIEPAVRAGACAVLVDEDRLPVDVGRPVLVAEDTRRVLGSLAEVFFGRPSRQLCVVGVTGTNGKTTTSWMLESLFRAEERNTGLLGTIGYRWGGHEEPAVNTTPESLVVQRLLARMRDDGVDSVAMEVSSHGLATHRLCGTHFDAAIFTNLTSEHLDFHGDMGTYRQAKARLFTELLPASWSAGKQPVAVINVDDAAGRWLAQRTVGRGVRCASFGLHSPADHRATDIEQGLWGSRFCVVGPEEDFELEIPLLGLFNVSNALGAAVAARAVGVSIEAIQRGFSQLGCVPGRMQRVEFESGPTVFVDYAHTPDAIETALRTVRPLTGGRVIVVFGCGGDRDRHKRSEMGRAAADGADVVVVTSDNPRTEDPREIISQTLGELDAEQLRDDSLARSASVWTQVDRGRAIAETIAQADEDDVILIAGKGHEAYQEINGERLPFDDVERARAALASRGPSLEASST